jgi:alpha/beta superfamily hydrolase
MAVDQIDLFPGPSAGFQRPDGGFEQAGFFGQGLFGVVHLPSSPATGSLVVCSPLLAEFQRNYRRETLLLREAASAGYAGLRFHYPGTANSAGDAVTLCYESMLEAALEAVDLMRAVYPNASLVMVGTRIGSLVASAAAAKVGADLVLWDPVPSAAKMIDDAVRAALLHAMVSAQGSRPSREEFMATLETGRPLDVLGYPIHSSLAWDPQTLVEALGGFSGRGLLLQFGGKSLRSGLAEAVAGHTFETVLAASPESWWATPGGGDYFRPEDRSPLTREVVATTIAFLRRRGETH